MTRALILLAALASVPSVAGQAQQPGPTNGTTTPPAGSSPTPAGQAASPPAEGYSYQPDNRRDPFVSAIGSGIAPRTPLKRSDGPAGLMVNEIAVRGIIKSKGALLAMIQAPDKKTYLVHDGDKLLDGTIKSVTPQSVLIVQDVNDPLSLAKQREVRKSLRSAEDSKP